ncbi:MarR family transcriptional regulator [Haloquadratum walsbyi]
MTEAAIDIDEFENAGADEFEEQSDTERIVLFLDKYNNRAWKAATIAEQLGLDTDAVSAILSRLKDRGLVRHKRPYWAISVDRGHRRHSGVAV